MRPASLPRSIFLMVACVLGCKATGQSSVRPTSATGPTTGPVAADEEQETDVDATFVVPAGRSLIVPLTQQMPGSPSQEWWLFDPERPLLAMLDTDDLCRAWDIPTGLVVDARAPGDDSHCDHLLLDEPPDAGEYVPGASVDGALIAAEEDGSLRIRDGEGKLLHTLSPCADCWFEFVWSPGDHRLAVVTEDPLSLQIWDADTGARVHSEAFGAWITSPELVADFRLRWNERGVVVLVEHVHEEPCVEEEYDYDSYDEPQLRCFYDENDNPLPDEIDAVSSLFWPDGGGPVRARIPLLRRAQLGDLIVDPHLRWVFVSEESYDPHEGTTVTVEALATTDLDSALRWEWFEPEFEEETVTDFEGGWRGDARTQWLETRVDLTYYDGGPDLVMSWLALVVEPSPTIQGALVYEGRELWDVELMPRLELYGAAAGEAITSWSVDEHDDTSEGQMLSLAGCEALDASPELAWVLADCSGSLALVEPGGGSGQGRVHMSLPVGAEAEWVWGRGGWLAALDPGKGLVIVDPGSAKLLHTRAGVDALSRVALAPQQDRLGVELTGMLELLDMPSGRTLLKIPAAEGLAGLSPDGERLATIANGLVHVWSVDTGEELASWPELDMHDVVWRQNGKRLLVGAGVPQKSLHPDTGTLARRLDDGPWTQIGPDDLDPSWRWAKLGDRRVMRTLDALELSYGWNTRAGQGWIRLDNGLYEGELSSRGELLGSVRYRISDDPLAVPAFTSAELDPWLRREGLLEAFFAGEAIDPPTISDDELAELRRGDGGGQAP